MKNDKEQPEEQPQSEWLVFHEESENKPVYFYEEVENKPVIFPQHNENLNTTHKTTHK